VFDQKHWFDIQVSSPYLHGNNGEGIYAVPEVGAKCMVCIPGDSSPPYVSSFVMPVEITDMATVDSPQGTTSNSSPGASTSGASFAGGRQRGKPGDIVMKGRDGNFVILHRGGVLQIGSTELSQRIFVPLNNMVMDVSDNYYHHNAGGTVYWGMQPTLKQDKFPSEYLHTFRIFANDKYADVRIKAGTIADPFKGTLDSKVVLGDVVYEVTVAPQGFDPTTGAIQDSKALTQRFAFDKTGNVLLGGTGSLSVNFNDNVSIDSGALLSLSAATSMTLKSEEIVLDAKNISLQGKTVKIGPGGAAAAHVGSVVKVTIPFTPMPVPGGPPLTLYGTVLSGENTVLI
jgi:hypothetical protein